MGRAIIQNIRARRIVSGASTLTMQVIRLSRRNRQRTVIEKCIELVHALKLELHTSKKEILNIGEKRRTYYQLHNDPLHYKVNGPLSLEIIARKA